MDFTNYPLSNRYYGGTERKIGINVNGRDCMLKFQKATAFGVRHNHISEHIGSLVFTSVGLPAQETMLGTYQGAPVVACFDFIEPGEEFVPFNDVGESSLDQDKDSFQYTYEDIIGMLEANTKLTDVKETTRLFWEMFVMDAFLGNFDRHGGNWGFLKQDNQYRPAPIFDNGSCLFPNLTDSQMQEVLHSQEEINRRVFQFPTSQILLEGKKSSYYRVISSLSFPECNKALASIMSRIDPDAIFSIVENMEGISDVRRDFYHTMLEARYRLILLDPYEKLMEGR